MSSNNIVLSGILLRNPNDFGSLKELSQQLKHNLEILIDPSKKVWKTSKSS